jgi:predicted Rossmann-fold nucleotide-binding protein
MSEKFSNNLERESVPEKLSAKFKRITVLGTFQEPAEQQRQAAVQLGKIFAEEGVTVLAGGQTGYPGAVHEGVLAEKGKILIANPTERQKQGKTVENVPGHTRGVDIEDWEHFKDFLFHESVDAYVFLPPSKTLGTVTEAMEAIDRMTYWGTIENPKISPTVFVGREWEDKVIPISGTEEKISLRQILESMINREKEAFDEKGVKLNKVSSIKFVETPDEAISFLRSWSPNMEAQASE